jgi:hypothetical protein
VSSRANDRGLLWESLLLDLSRDVDDDACGQIPHAADRGARLADGAGPRGLNLRCSFHLVGAEALSVVGRQLRGMFAYGWGMLDSRVCASVEECGR